MGDLFRSLWGKQAGWAHSVLFAADLRAFAERLSTKLEVTEVKKEEEEETETSLKSISETSITANTGVKRELSDEEKTLQEVSLTRKVKRRRKV